MHYIKTYTSEGTIRILRIINLPIQDQIEIFREVSKFQNSKYLLFDFSRNYNVAFEITNDSQYIPIHPMISEYIKSCTI